MLFGSPHGKQECSNVCALVGDNVRARFGEYPFVKWYTDTNINITYRLAYSKESCNFQYDEIIDTTAPIPTVLLVFVTEEAKIGKNVLSSPPTPRELGSLVDKERATVTMPLACPTSS